MFKGKIPNFFYLIHLLFILALWILFFIIFFSNSLSLKLNFPPFLFKIMVLFGLLSGIPGIFFLRKSSLTDDENKMFKFVKIGDLLLLFGFILLFSGSFLYGKIEISLGIILTALIILQTHFPLVEDESLYPEEIKNENFYK